MTLDARTSKLVTEPMANAFAAGLRSALAQGASPTDLIQMLLDNACSIAARIEPPGVRAKFVEGIVDSIPKMVRDHLGALAAVSPSSIIRPGSSNGLIAGS